MSLYGNSITAYGSLDTAYFELGGARGRVRARRISVTIAGPRACEAYLRAAPSLGCMEEARPGGSDTQPDASRAARPQPANLNAPVHEIQKAKLYPVEANWLTVNRRSLHHFICFKSFASNHLLEFPSFFHSRRAASTSSPRSTTIRISIRTFKKSR
jgi:hypothetical protein